jgi:hypothetical protein
MEIKHAAQTYESNPNPGASRCDDPCYFQFTQRVDKARGDNGVTITGWNKPKKTYENINFVQNI